MYLRLHRIAAQLADNAALTRVAARLPVVLGGLLYVVAAGAQVTGSFEIVSDYRFRGVSLSREKPAAQVTAVYDQTSGVYGGLFVSSVEFATASKRAAQIIGFLGSATPVSNAVHADFGIQYAAFGRNLQEYDYGEIYGGILSRRWSVRVHYSPDYFATSRSSLYGEFDATHSINDAMALFAHVGVLVATMNAAVAPNTAVRYPVDGRAGVTLDIAGFNVQIAWVATNAMRSAYPVDSRQKGNAFVLSVSRAL